VGIILGFASIFAVLACFIGFPFVAFLILLCGVFLAFTEPREPVLRLIAKFTKGYVVVLREHQGETALSIAYLNAYGEMYCYYHWATNTRFCLLMDSGKVQKASYVEQWRYTVGQNPDVTKGWKRDGVAQ
jgi:hypothetical protein